MTQDPAGREDYVLAPVEQRVEDTGGIFLPVAGYGGLRFLVDRGILTSGPRLATWPWNVSRSCQI